MLSKGELKVYSVLYKNKEGLHLREICRRTNLTLPTVSKHINRGVEEDRINKTKKAQLVISKLNFSSPKLVPIIKEIEVNRYKNLPRVVRESINSFLDDIPEKPLIALVFGSYANENYSKKSDLDILLVFQRLNHKLIEKIEERANKIKGRTGMDIEPVSMSYDDFQKKILNKEDEFTKDIRKDSLVLKGLEDYLSLIGRFYS